MTRTPLPISFYVPVKDGEPFIGACLDSILAQTQPPERIVVYYNVTSTDRTREILARYPAIDVVDVTVPLSDARNLATQTLTHEWVACCDADVVLAPDWLEKLWAHRANYVVISGNTRERIRTAGDHFRSITSPHNWGPHDVVNPYMLVPDMLAHRPTLLDIGGYQSGWVNYEDSEISHRLKEQGKQFYYVADAHAEHWRSDTPASCLDLRWRHSFHRQAMLFQTMSGMQQKARNNIALATLIFSRAAVDAAHDVMPICLQLPLHHLLRDAQHLQRMEVTIPDSVRVGRAPPIQKMRAALMPSWTPTLESLWNECAACPITPALAAANADLFTRFARAAATHAPQAIDATALLANADENPWATTDDQWQTLCATAVAHVAELHRTVPTQTDALHDDLPFPTLTNGTGLLTYRQRLFPTPLQIWNCRALTSELAARGKTLLWTETFQGSTVIAYE